jgi:hypothetical protein
MKIFRNFFLGIFKSFGSISGVWTKDLDFQKVEKEDLKNYFFQLLMEECKTSATKKDWSPHFL